MEIIINETLFKLAGKNSLKNHRFLEHVKTRRIFTVEKLSKIRRIFGALEHEMFGASKSKISNAQIEDLQALLLKHRKSSIFESYEFLRRQTHCV